MVFITGTVTAPGDAEYVDGRKISFDFFSTLGLPLLQGREFLKQEDRPGGTPVAIISYNMWQRRFAASSNAVGSQIVFDAKSYTVVGIAPRAFRWLGNEVDVFTPIGQSTEPYMRNRSASPRLHGCRTASALAPHSLRHRLNYLCSGNSWRNSTLRTADAPSPSHPCERI